MITVAEIVRFLETKAPVSLAEEWDNPGLLVGDETQEVSGVLVCLDITSAVVEAAVKAGASLIISHHPVIFNPIKRLESHSVPYRLAANGIAALALHTNLDAASGGVNDDLSARLGLVNVAVQPDGIVRTGMLPKPFSAEAFAKHASAVLHTPVRWHEGEGAVNTVAVCGGAGGDLVQEAAADAVVTGELKHHEWLALAEQGKTIVEAGHYETEVGVVDTLSDWLKEAFPTLAVQSFEGEPPYITIEGR